MKGDIGAKKEVRNSIGNKLLFCAKTKESDFLGRVFFFKCTLRLKSISHFLDKNGWIFYLFLSAKCHFCYPEESCKKVFQLSNCSGCKNMIGWRTWWKECVLKTFGALIDCVPISHQKRTFLCFAPDWRIDEKLFLCLFFFPKNLIFSSKFKNWQL